MCIYVCQTYIHTHVHIYYTCIRTYILDLGGRHWVEQGVRVAEVKTSGREFSVEKRKAYLILRQKEMGRKMFKAGKVVDRIHM